MKMKIFLAGFFAALFFLAPQGQAHMAQAPEKEDLRQTGDLTGHKWVLDDIRGHGVVAAAGIVATLDIAPDGRVAGNTGCNVLMGRADVGAGTLSIGPLAVSKRACLQSAAMDQEGAYLDALAEATGWRIDAHGNLHLTGKAGADILRFVRG